MQVSIITTIMLTACATGDEEADVSHWRSYSTKQTFWILLSLLHRRFQALPEKPHWAVASIHWQKSCLHTSKNQEFLVEHHAWTQSRVRRGLWLIYSVYTQEWFNAKQKWTYSVENGATTKNTNLKAKSCPEQYESLSLPGPVHLLACGGFFVSLPVLASQLRTSGVRWSSRSNWSIQNFEMCARLHKINSVVLRHLSHAVLDNPVLKSAHLRRGCSSWSVKLKTWVHKIWLAVSQENPALAGNLVHIKQESPTSDSSVWQSDSDRIWLQMVILPT